MNLKEIYIHNGALLEGHFILSSGNHSRNYLQSAKVLENPKVAEMLAIELAQMIKSSGIEIDTICSPALGGLLAGYELARALGIRFIFTERKDDEMQLRRGFSVQKGERVLICEDIITTGGSALEAGREIEKFGGKIVGFSAIANRGFCKRIGGNFETDKTCKLPKDLPLFAIDDFTFEIYSPNNCPICAEGTPAIKPGSRGNN
jgi:orotate phosphoribosyltransferase